MRIYSLQRLVLRAMDRKIFLELTGNEPVSIIFVHKAHQKSMPLTR